MRVVSLLPAATEIVAALGMLDQLVGVSHECDYPLEVQAKPRVTHCAIHGGALASEEADRWVSDALAAAGTLYSMDEALIRRLQPDVIITQRLCDVCAVGYESVTAFAATLPGPPHVINLDPSSVPDVLQDIRHAGRVEVDHMRRTGESGGEGGDALVADGTDVAQTLCDDDVRLEPPDERLVHAVERARGGERVAHPAVGLLARERAAVDRTARDARLGLGLERVVALVAHAHQLVEHPERGHDLGRRGEQRDDAHP